MLSALCDNFNRAFTLDNQNLMATNFRNAFSKLGVVGQNTSKLIDCSELVPTAPPAPGKPAT